MEFWGAPWVSVGLHGALWEFQGAPWGSRGIRSVSRGSVGFCGASWGSTGPRRGSRQGEPPGAGAAELPRGAWDGRRPRLSVGATRSQSGRPGPRGDAAPAQVTAARGPDSALGASSCGRRLREQARAHGCSQGSASSHCWPPHPHRASVAQPSCAVPVGTLRGRHRLGSPGCRLRTLPTGRRAWDRAPAPAAEGPAAGVSDQRRAPGTDGLSSRPALLPLDWAAAQARPPGGPGAHTCAGRGSFRLQAAAGGHQGDGAECLESAPPLGTGRRLDGPLTPGWSSPGRPQGPGASSMPVPSVVRVARWVAIVPGRAC